MACALPALALTASKSQLIRGAWIPFWKQIPGIQEITNHLPQFQEISPFSYEVRLNGTLVDKLKIDEGLWPNWLLAVHDLKIKIIPTIAWFDGDAIHALLKNTKARQKHEDAIAKLVADNKFDGIDIDYESKLAETKNHFSTFIKGLALRLHPKGKLLTCTIEARMPLKDRYAVIPADTRVANDYVALNKYCDEVRIMAYDQGGIDLTLNKSKGVDALYAPVADPVWVEKTIKEALKSIKPSKIMLAVPTYGYEYEILQTDTQTTYKRLRSHTYLQAMTRAQTVGVTPTRNSAGELSFTYTTSTSISVSPALTFITFSATSTSSTSPLATSSATSGIIRFVSFTDAESIAQKIKLAKKYKLRGVILFKLDGETDPALWQNLK